VLIQKSHRYGYDHAVRACGVKLVEVETEADYERSVNEKTAMALFFNDNTPKGKIDAAGWVRLGKKFQIPTCNDASADALPVERLSLYNKMGFDLVTFSGGKGICAPQSTGILMGRKDLIAAARLNTAPFSDTIGRGLKVNKEEMLGLLVALEMYIQRDHEAEKKEWERRVAVIQKAVEKLPTVRTSVMVPEIANHTPHLCIEWDAQRIRMSPQEVKTKLLAGEPSIEACPLTDAKGLWFTVWMLQPGEAEQVAKRSVEILKSGL
jgi:seryl-tRNA(Sec) selenium transferase